MAPQRMLHGLEILETVKLGAKPATPVQYEWEFVFRGARAEAVRARFAREGSVGVFKAYSDDVQRSFPAARVVSQNIKRDDIAENTFSFTEVYEIGDAWKRLEDGRYLFQTFDRVMKNSLAPMDPGERKLPIFLGYPGRRTRTVHVHSTINHSGGWSEKLFRPALGYSDDMRMIEPRHILIEQSLTIAEQSLPAADADIYRRIQERMLRTDLSLVAATDHSDKFKAAKVRSRGIGIVNWVRILFIGAVIVNVLVRCAMTASP